MKLKVEINETSELLLEENDGQLSIDNAIVQYELKRISESEYLLKKGSKNYKINIAAEKSGESRIEINGISIKTKVKDHITQILEDLGMDLLTEVKISEVIAPMPGTILDIAVADGQEVQAGDTILILEAMKMENIIKSPISGVIRNINVRKGQSVEKNFVLASF